MRKATVARMWAETPNLTAVRLDAAATTRSEHTVPGQIISARTEADKTVFLALASLPGAPQLELLVAPSAIEDLSLAVGVELAIEGPFGKGFPIAPARGKDVLLFAVGSALAPIRPVVEAVRQDRTEFGRVTLFIGAMDTEAFAYQSDYGAWMRDRIDVVKVLHPEFVQDVFAADPLPVDDCVAYVCGMEAMMDGVTEVLGRHGLAAEHVYRNW